MLPCSKRLGRDALAPRRFFEATPGAKFFCIIVMRLFYLDESGNPEITGSSGSYVLAAIGLPIERWTACDKAINQLKSSHYLGSTEIHTAWMLRSYSEQLAIPSFDKMGILQRRDAVLRIREKKIEQYKKEKSPQALKGLKKNYKNTEAYIHLTLEERKRFINELAAKIKSWTFLRLFGEVIDKNNYHPPKPGIIPQTQAFERIVTRIEKYLSHISMETNEYGLLIHDECESVAAAHVSKMKQYHIRGTFKSRVDHIIKTPLFVSSNHTNMVQIADLCAYILRRYYDLGEQTLYDVIKTRIDKAGGDVVGLNHYTNNKDCPCEVCRKKRRKQTFSHHSL